jgi:hypothetical protein
VAGSTFVGDTASTEARAALYGSANALMATLASAFFSLFLPSAMAIASNAFRYASAFGFSASLSKQVERLPVSLRALSSPTAPVEGAPFLTSDRENPNVILSYAVVHAVRKPPHEPPAHVTIDRLSSEGRSHNCLDRTLHLSDKRLAEPGTRVGVVGGSLV